MRAVLVCGAVALVAMLATGCARDTAVKVDPVAVSCDSVCFTPCVTAGIAWRADPTQASAWDAIGPELVLPLKQATDQCELRRDTCHRCLWRLQEQGLIVGVPKPPPEPPQ